jgi:hypothetical protein
MPHGIMYTSSWQRMLLWNTLANVELQHSMTDSHRKRGATLWFQQDAHCDSHTRKKTCSSAWQRSR